MGVIGKNIDVQLDTTQSIEEETQEMKTKLLTKMPLVIAIALTWTLGTAQAAQIGERTGMTTTDAKIAAALGSGERTGMTTTTYSWPPAPRTWMCARGNYQKGPTWSRPFCCLFFLKNLKLSPLTFQHFLLLMSFFFTLLTFFFTFKLHPLFYFCIFCPWWFYGYIFPFIHTFPVNLKPCFKFIFTHSPPPICTDIQSIIIYHHTVANTIKGYRWISEIIITRIKVPSL